MATTTVASYRKDTERPFKNGLGEPGYRWVILSCGHTAISNRQPGDAADCIFAQAVPGSPHWRFGDATPAEALRAIHRENVAAGMSRE